MNVLGVSCYYHDSAVALLQDGVVVAAAQEERFSRIKHDSQFPQMAITFCLRRANITHHDIDYVVFYEKPNRKLHRILTTCAREFPFSWHVFRNAMNEWLAEKMWIRRRLQSYFLLPYEKVLFVEHHLSHAASAFFCSPFAKAAILTIDGVGEWTTTTIGVGTATWDPDSENSIEFIHRLNFPNSLGLLYSTFTSFLGFHVNDGEGKVMGLAPYGKPRYLNEIHNVARLYEDGSLQLNMEYFAFLRSVSQPFTNKFIRLFGEPRKPTEELAVTNAATTAQSWGQKEGCRFADIAASIQAFTDDALLRMTRNAYEVTGLSNLCLAGGVALNSLTNGKIARESPFDNVWIQPAAGDAGGALGAALYAYHVLLQKPRQYVMDNAFLGESYTTDAIRVFLDASNISYTYLDTEDALVCRVVDYLSTGKTIGWFQGRFEWGPRALGNRSILADSRVAKMKDLINYKVKFREPYRPLAPVVPFEHASQFFELPSLGKLYPTQFMLLVLPILSDKRQLIPAVDHMGTGRVQIITEQTNPIYYKLVRQFGDATDVPVLINTSLNLRGEPIVASPADAYRTFQRTGLDILVMDRFIVTDRGGEAMSNHELYSISNKASFTYPTY